MNRDRLLETCEKRKMSSPSAAVNSDAAMVQGRPLSSEKNEKILDGMKAMHLGGNTSSSHPTSGMAEPTARQSNKHSNAGRLHTKHCSIHRYIYFDSMFLDE